MSILDPKPPTRAELTATYAQQWKPATAYAAGQPVVNPSGDVVTSKTAHTSGSSYNPANWDASPAVAAKLDKAEAATSYAKQGTPPRVYLARPVAVADNTSAVGTSSNSQTAASTSRRSHVVGFDCADVQLVYTNNYVNVGVGDVDNPNPATIKAAVEIAGVIYPVTFNGSKTGTLEGGGVLTSDPLGVDIAAGTTIYSRTYISATTWYPNAAAFSSSGFGGRVAGDSAHSGTINDSGAYMFAPAAIIAVPTTAKPGLLIVGDSISEGVGDRTGGSRSGVSTSGNGGGFIARAARTVKVPTVSVAQSSERAEQFAVQIGHLRRAPFARFATHAICEYARNDIGQTGRTLATVQSDAITCWKILSRRGVKTVQTTTTPSSTSTDGWGTTTNQASNGNSIILSPWNNWLRDGAPMVNNAAAAVGTSGAARCTYYGANGDVVTPASGPAHYLDGVYEVADTATSARNSDIWKATGRMVTDVVATAASQVITSATANFTSADIGTAVVIQGAGTSGGVHQTWIASVQSATQATMDGAAVTATTAAQATIGGATGDGLHPSPTMHAAMASAMSGFLTKWLGL